MKRFDRLQEEKPEGTSEFFPERMPERMSESQNEPQIKICQIECQKMYRTEKVV